MDTYIKLDLLTGTIKSITTNKIPIPKNNEIIYDQSLFSEKKGTLLTLREISERYKRSQFYVKESAMGHYGKGLFTRSKLPENALFLPYVGLYARTTENKKFEKDYVNSNYNIAHGDSSGHVDYACWANENTCFAHSAQHFSTKSEHAKACNANLVPDNICFEIKYDRKTIYLPLIFLKNIKALNANYPLGFDYGDNYWLRIQSGFVEWDSKGNRVNKIALLWTKIRGRDHILTISQNPETKFFSLPDTHMIIFPKGMREALFNSVNLLDALPTVLLPTKLMGLSANGDKFISLPITNSSKEKDISIDHSPNYRCINHTLHLGIKFLESLTAYELRKLFEKLNIPEVILSDVKGKSLVSAESAISYELITLFKILNIHHDLENEPKKIHSTSNFFKSSPSKSSIAENTENIEEKTNLTLSSH